MIILIAGKIGSGKTIAAEYLKNKHDFAEATFAGPLKEIVKILGFSERQVYGTQEDKLEIHERYGVSAREVLQKLGTEMFRNNITTYLPNMKLNGSIWIDLMEQKLLVHDPKTNLVVSDCRFKNELKIVKKYKAVSIYLLRNNGHNSSSCSSHASENSIFPEDCDIVYDNSGTIEDLYRFLDTLCYNTK